MKFDGKVAIITGASRGIGRELALGLAREGCHVVVAAKTVEENPKLPGTIHSVAAEVEALGRKALPFQVDLRDGERIEQMVQATLETFGRVDFLVNNAGALFWHNLKDTPTKRYDLVHQVNARATFIASREVLAPMLEQGFGHIVNMSPPFEPRLAVGKVAYAISKLGMTLVTTGLSEELSGSGVAVNSLWPETMVESYAVKNWNLGGKEMWRSPQIMVDALLEIFSRDPKTFTGHCLLDETFLREECGVEDFSRYQCVEGSEPPKLSLDWAIKAGKK